jgi:hypothetical protein
MIRKLVSDKPLTAAQRRKRSNDEKIARGERHLNTWLEADAAKALDHLTGPDATRGAISAAVNEALKEQAKRKRG